MHGLGEVADVAGGDAGHGDAAVLKEDVGSVRCPQGHMTLPW